MITWFLKKGEDRRVRSQHPWVFSNEINGSPKGALPGGPIELRDMRGEVVARGYGNPHSLISFRALSFGAESEATPWERESLLRKLKQAWKRRLKSGCQYSFRLCFSEADFFPGLIVDYFTVQNGEHTGQVFSVQVLTAGASHLLGDLNSFFEELTAIAYKENLSSFDWERTGLVIRNDVQIRKLEGLPVEEPKIAKEISGVDFRQAPLVLEGSRDKKLILKADLVDGQKTGFFLDQWENIQIAKSVLRRSWTLAKPKEPIRILDLCCYVGHWGSQLASLCEEMNVPCEVVLFDISKTALEFAENNVRANSQAKVSTVMGDALEDLGQFADNSFDIVIADPPAFIKNKKDVPIGRHAYLKMNSQAFRISKVGGWVVSCSCSGLLPENEFAETLSKSAFRAKKKAPVIARGGHGSDHPFLHSFPEGRYLKMFLQSVEQ